MLCGTGHVVYTMLPIVYDVAIKNNVRPERPMAASSIGAQMGIIASPVSVAVVSLVAFLAKAPVNGQVIDFVQLLSITIPSTLAGVLAIGIFSWFRGKDLDKDEEFQAFIAKPESRIRLRRHDTLLDKKLATAQWIAMSLFIGAIVVVSLLGAFEGLRPLIDGKPMSMVLTIQMFMLLAGALIVILQDRCGGDRQKRGVPRRHDRGGGRVRRRLDGGHDVRGPRGLAQDGVGGRRQVASLDLRPDAADRFQVRQLAGGGDRGAGPGGAVDRRAPGLL